jgi:hypothetical protein
MSNPDWRRQIHRSEDPHGTLRIRDFGDYVHLWFTQRVSWPIALEILKELKAPGPADDAISRERRNHLKRRLPRRASQVLNRRAGPHKARGSGPDESSLTA